MNAPATITVTSAGAIAWIRLDHPARRNAITLTMWRQLAEALAELNAQDTIRAAIIAGAGDEAFASGADIGSFQPQLAQQDSELTLTTRAAWQALDDFEKPLIAMIHGYCFGAGVALACKADVRIASTDARFAIPAGRLGLAYPMPHIESLVRLVGPGAAKSLLFTAERIDAQQALRIGLVDELVVPEQASTRVRQVADAIVQNAPLTLRAAKASIDLASGRRRDTQAVAALNARCASSADHAEGVSAYLHKRQPVFRGQ